MNESARTIAAAIGRGKSQPFKINLEQEVNEDNRSETAIL